MLHLQQNCCIYFSRRCPPLIVRRGRKADVADIEPWEATSKPPDQIGRERLGLGATELVDDGGRQSGVGRGVRVRRRAFASSPMSRPRTNSANSAGPTRRPRVRSSAGRKSRRCASDWRRSQRGRPSESPPRAPPNSPRGRQRARPPRRRSRRARAADYLGRAASVRMPTSILRWVDESVRSPWRREVTSVCASVPNSPPEISRFAPAF